VAQRAARKLSSSSGAIVGPTRSLARMITYSSAAGDDERPGTHHGQPRDSASLRLG
jgi:hypothetical protein